MTNIVIAFVITVSLAHVVLLSPPEGTTEHIDNIEEKVNVDVESSTVGVDSVTIDPIKNISIEDRSSIDTETVTEPVTLQSITTENFKALVTENNLDEVTTIQSRNDDGDIVEDVDSVVKSLTQANSSEAIIGTRRSYSSLSHSENKIGENKVDKELLVSKSKSQTHKVSEKVISGFEKINNTEKNSDDSLESKDKIHEDKKSNDKPTNIEFSTKKSIINIPGKPGPIHVEVNSKVADDEIQEKSAEPAVEINNKLQEKPTNIKSIPGIITKPEKINDKVEGKSNTDDFEEHRTEMVPTNESNEHSKIVTVKAPTMNGHPLKKRRKLKNLSPDNQPTLSLPHVLDTLLQNSTPHVTNIQTYQFAPEKELIALTPDPTNSIPSLLSFTPSPPKFPNSSPLLTPSSLPLTTSSPIFTSSPELMKTSRPGQSHTSPPQSPFPIVDNFSSLIPSSFTPPIFHNINQHPLPTRRNQFLWPQAPYPLQEDPKLNHYLTPTIENNNGNSQQHHIQSENQGQIPESLNILAMMSQIQKPKDIYGFGNVFYDNNMYPLIRNGRDHRETVQTKEKLNQIPESVLDDLIRAASTHRKIRDRDNV